MRRTGVKLGQNPFQTILHVSFFDVEKNFRRADPDRDQCETDPRPKTGPDRTGFDVRSDGPEEHSFSKHGMGFRF